MRTKLVSAALGAGLALSAMPALSAPMDVSRFFAPLTTLNDSGITGRADFILDRSANTLTTKVNVSGLAPNTLHPQHLHGRFKQRGCTINAPSSSPVAGECLDGTRTRNSIIPTVARNDIDGDGFLETVEGLPAYGPIILNLADASAGRSALPGSFPMSDDMGNLMFTETYDLSTTDLLFDPLNGIEHEVSDLFSLDKRVYVIHGVTVTNNNPAVPNDMFEIQGPTDGAEYITLLPGAAGQVQPVPLPAAGWMLLSALGGLGLLGRSTARRRKA